MILFAFIVGTALFFAIGLPVLTLVALKIAETVCSMFWKGV
jgi:hypothetical protein